MFQHTPLGTPALARITPTEAMHFTLGFTSNLSLYTQIQYVEVCVTLLFFNFLKSIVSQFSNLTEHCCFFNSTSKQFDCFLNTVFLYISAAYW